MRLQLTFAVACILGLGAARAADRSAEFEVFMEKTSADFVRLSPTFATSTQYFTGEEQDALDRQLEVGPYEPAEIAAAERLEDSTLEGLRGFREEDLKPEQRLVLESRIWSLETSRAYRDQRDVGYVFHQMGGDQIGLVSFLSVSHPIRNAKDVENYLVRLTQVSKCLRSSLKEAARREAKGIIPPRFIVQATLKTVDGFLAPEAADNVLVASLAERMAEVSGFSEEQRRNATERAVALVAQDIRPAFAELRNFLQEQEKKATDEPGISARPGGAKAYEAGLRSSTTTTLSPSEIHEIGLREVARIEKEMDGLLRQAGYTSGTIKERYRALTLSALPPENPDPREKILAQLSEILRDAEQRSKSLFAETPKAPLVVKREPAFSESGSAAHYSAPAPDGSKPGIYFCPLPRVSADQMWLGAGMKTVAYHEGIPGHHYQIALAMEQADAPKYKRLGVVGGYTAYIEGWALYAERLAAESGWYGSDLTGRIGQLNLELVRARRLVVDTGLHAKGWTRQQAIDYGFSPEEVERYCVLPGQACAYKIGELKIVELRELARKELGARFDIKRFHSTILRTGEVPLAVLERAVRAWIAEVEKG